jgi:teichuronic acid biosynthesis glycosyltransferase TuaH
MHPLIFVSLENWDQIWRRNQFICAEISRRFPRQPILFVGPPRDLTNQIRHRRFRGLTVASSRRLFEFPNITITRPLKVMPNSLAFGRRINAQLALRHVQEMVRRLGITDPLLWVNAHYALPLTGKLGERALIYDITDDWTQLPQGKAEQRRVAAQDAALCRRADAVIVCSERLHALKKPFTRNLHLIRNGVDAPHYARVLDGTGPLPALTSQWPIPVLGYTGTVHPDRLNLELVIDVARKLKRGSIVLLGPNYLQKTDRNRLDAAGNIFCVPAVPYSEVPDYMRAFDVCIAPHQVNLFTESLNPIKLWEYLAAGKPIVATDVPGFRDYPQHVRVANDSMAFVRAVEEALLERSDAREARRAEARRNSWESRVDDILAVIAECAPLDDLRFEEAATAAH